MDYKEEILTHVAEYLKLVNWDFKAKKENLYFVCPFCKSPAQTAQQIPHSYKLKCLNPQCPNKGKKFSLISFIRLTEAKKIQWTEKNLLHHIKIKLGLDIQSPIDRENVGELFKMYKENGFSLMPVRRLAKEAIETDWQITEHREIGEWEQYIKREVNIGLRTGESSNITVVDIDCLTKKEEYELLQIYNDKSKIKRKQEIKAKIKIPQEIKKTMGETLIQKTWKGFHLIYKYESELRKSPIVLEETNIDIENNGGYIVITPSIIHRYYKIKEPGAKYYNKEKIFVNLKTKREFINTNPIIQMSKELKEMIIKAQKERGGDKEEDKLENSIELDIMNENFKIDPKDFNLKYNGLEGCCNDSFIRLGGVIRKQLNAQNTEYVLRVLNKHMLEDPMENKAITAIIRQLNKYDWFNEEKLNSDVLNYIKDSEESSKDDIERALVGNRPKGEDKLRLDKCIAYLLRENYIKKIRGIYTPIKRLNLKTSLISIYKPIDFKEPYFDDMMYFAYGDVILIGARPGTGKTHLAINIIKRLVAQKIRPIYVSLETGSRFLELSLKMRFTESEYTYDDEQENATDFEFEDNAITIIDWLMPRDFKYMDKIIAHFKRQLKKHGGFLYLFVQLRSNGDWFAKDLIEHFPAMTVKYFLEDGNRFKGWFEIEKRRAAKRKTFNQKIVPTIYNWDTEEVLRVDEIKKDTTIKAVPIEEVNLGSGEEK